MKTFFVLLVSFFSSSIFAQSESLTQIYNATSVALGEASVANQYYGIPSDINPALLSNAEDLIVYYNERSINWMKMLDEFKFLSIGVQIPTSIGSFALNYKKFDQGNLTISTPESPDGIGEMDRYDHTLEAMYGTKIYKNLSVGATFKLFTIKNSIGVTSDDVKFNTPMFLDLGFTYKIDEIISSSRFTDNLVVGIDIKNFGTDFIQTNQYNNTFGFDETGTEETVIKVERFLRIGFGYNLKIVSENDSPIFSFLFSAEYKNQLNNNYYDRASKDFWGMGMEASFYDLVSLRLGASALPFTSIYGLRGNFSSRYGIGLQSPLLTAIKNLPFKVVFDYSVIPLSYDSSFFNNEGGKNLYAFNISLRFPGFVL